MKVWIHINGVQEGPYELHELPLDRMTALTPVWHEGLPSWLPASQVPLVAEQMAGAGRQEQAQQQFQQQFASPAAAHQSQAEPEKAPASYLVWSILMTVLCCNPIGIVPIITGVVTRSRYSNRDYAGSKRMSEATAWWVMITIVTCLMLMPFAMLMN